MAAFEEFLYRNRIKKTEIANYLGVGNSFITKLSNGARNIPPDKLQKILDNPDWDTSMLAGIKMAGSCGSESERAEEKEKEYPTIPLLPFTAVAGFMSENNGIDAFRGEKVVFGDFTSRGADCAIRVDGDSMYPRYRNGDILAIRIIKNPSFFQWGRVYVLSTIQGCVVKKLYPDANDPERIVCHSENSELYPDYSIPKDEVLGVAIVVGHAGVE